MYMYPAKGNFLELRLPLNDLYNLDIPLETPRTYPYDTALPINASLLPIKHVNKEIIG